LGGPPIKAAFVLFVCLIKRIGKTIQERGKMIAQETEKIFGVSLFDDIHSFVSTTTAKSKDLISKIDARCDELENMENNPYSFEEMRLFGEIRALILQIGGIS